MKILYYIQEWAKKYGGWAHIFGAAIAAIPFIYAGVPEFKALCLHVWSVLPASAKEVAMAISGVYIWYKNNSRNTANGDSVSS